MSATYAKAAVLGGVFRNLAPGTAQGAMRYER